MEEGKQIRPTVPGTFAILAACMAGYAFSFQEAAPSAMARVVGIIVLTGIISSFLLDWRQGLRNLIRVDVFALLAFYFLTFFEFLFPQGQFDLLVLPEDVQTSVQLFLIGLGAMSVGRHLDIFPKGTLNNIGGIELRPRDFLLIFFGAAFLNFLPMLLAVDFNPVTWFEETLKPRFGRAWARGKYGDISALLSELQLLGYVLPPIAGVIYAHRKDYSKFVLLLVGLVIAVLFYTAFSEGTRNVLAIQVAGLFAGYFVVQRQLKLKIIIPVTAVVAVTFVVLAGMMLDFRNMGLGRYVKEGYYTAEYKEYEETYLSKDKGTSGYFVDYNLWRMSQIVGAFPDLYDFIGWNMPYVALTKPIPRALWPSKPEGLKVSLEEAIGAEGMTIAVTWVGEAYIAGGIPWIIGIGIIIGAFCCYWNGLANYVQYAFPALIVMGVFIYKQRNEGYQP
jgi:hypothetical protein